MKEMKQMTSTNAAGMKFANSSRIGQLPRGESENELEQTTSINEIAEGLVSGCEQKITIALFEMQQVFEFCREYAVQTLIPLMCAEVCKWDTSLQISAGETLISVVNSELQPEVAKLISVSASNIIQSCEDSSVYEVWGEILVSVLPVVSWSGAELDKVLGQIGRRHEIMGVSMSKRLTARILGSLAVCSKDEQLKRRILDRAISMANDSDSEVRGMIAESMSFIGAAVEIHIVEKELWPYLQTFIRDTNQRVHAAAIRTIAFIASAHQSRSPAAILFKQLLPKVFINECARVKQIASQDLRCIDDDKCLVLEINAEVFGQLLNSCHMFLPNENSLKDVYKAFRAMSTCNGPVIRKYCAYNLPAICLCYVHIYRTDLSAIAEFFSRDAEPETRWILAAGIHETTRILVNRDTLDNLVKSAFALLSDSNSLVRLNALKNFKNLISNLTTHSSFAFPPVKKLAPIFENLRLLSDGNWRTQELLALQLKDSTPFIPPTHIKTHVVPLLFQISEESSYLVRKAAMSALATCIRFISDSMERDTVMQYFKRNWGDSSVYWMRISFIECAKTAAQTYSKCLFRDTFASQVLKLANDPVSNVRLRVAMIFPTIAPACHQMDQFREVQQLFENDTDADVKEVSHDLQTQIQESLKKAQENFEHDLELEFEEQNLFSHHVKARRNANKRKISVKVRPNSFLGRATKGLQTAGSKSGFVNTQISPKEFATQDSNDKAKRIPSESWKQR